MGRLRQTSGLPLAGILLLVVGVVLLLGNLELLDYDLGDLISQWWPAILLVLGVSHLVQGRYQSAFILLLLGASFLLFTLDLLNLRLLRSWWPLALIAVGGVMVYRFFQGGEPGSRGEAAGGQGAEQGDDATVLDRGESFRVFQMLGATARALTSTSFRGGDATAFLGGVEIDLTRCRPIVEGARIEVTAILGGIELAVPRSWDVTVTGVPLLGGIADKRNPEPAGEDRPRLHVRATVLMGGLEIR